MRRRWASVVAVKRRKRVTTGRAHAVVPRPRPRRLRLRPRRWDTDRRAHSVHPRERTWCSQRMPRSAAAKVRGWCCYYCRHPPPSSVPPQFSTAGSRDRRLDSHAPSFSVSLGVAAAHAPPLPPSGAATFGVARDDRTEGIDGDTSGRGGEEAEDGWGGGGAHGGAVAPAPVPVPAVAPAPLRRSREGEGVDVARAPPRSMPPRFSPPAATPVTPDFTHALSFYASFCAAAALRHAHQMWRCLTSLSIIAPTVWAVKRRQGKGRPSDS